MTTNSSNSLDSLAHFFTPSFKWTLMSSEHSVTAGNLKALKGIILVAVNELVGAKRLLTQMKEAE